MKPTRGMLVYRPYKPQTVGIVTAFEPIPENPGLGFYVTVRWLVGGKKSKVGTTETIRDFHLHSFNDLIHEHEKKLATHVETRERAQFEAYRLGLP